MTSLQFWIHLFGSLVLGSTIIAGAAILLESRIPSAVWRRALWQITFVLFLALTISELSGFGRGTAAFFFGKPQSVKRMTLKPSPPKAPKASAAAGITVPLVDPLATAKTVWWPGMIWLAGAGLIITRILFSQTLCLALRFRRTAVDNQDLTTRVSKISEQLGLWRSVRLMDAAGLKTPIAFGVVHPAIGLPSDFTTRYDKSQQDAMLAHELAHLAALDPLWRLLVDLIAALFWLQPLTWLARRRFHTACEMAADDATAILENGPSALAECLLALGHEIAGVRRWAWIGVDGSGFKSNLGRRIERLLQFPTTTITRPRKSITIAKAAVATSLAVLTIVVSGWTEEQASEKPGTWGKSVKQSWSGSPGAILLMAAAEKNDDSGDRMAPAMTNTTDVSSTNVPIQLYSKTFQLNPNTAVQNLRNALLTQHAAIGTNDSFNLRTLLGLAGVNLKAPGKSAFFNDKLGTVLVRVSMRDLEIVEKVLQNVNRAPVQMVVEATFYELDHKAAREFSAMIENLPIPEADKHRVLAPEFKLTHIVSDPDGVRTNIERVQPFYAAPDSTSGIFNAEQYRLVRDYLAERQGVRMLALPKITTLSGRQARIGIDESPPLGVQLDLIPTVMPDTNTIDILAIPSITTRYEDRPGKTLSYETNTFISRFETKDQRAVMLSNMSVRNGETGTHLVVIIYPALIDPAGNLLHTPE